jgi:hypothetical protein
MSRSRRHTSICAMYLPLRTSQKWCKQHWHRQMRVHNRIRPHLIDVDTFLLADQRAFNADRDLGQSGKVWFDPCEHPEWLRK